METLLDYNVFSPLHETTSEDFTPLFDNDYIIDMQYMPGKSYLLKENYLVQKDAQNNNEKLQDPSSLTIEAVPKKRKLDELSKEIIPKPTKSVPSEILDGSKLYDDELEVLNEIFLSDIFSNDPQNDSRAPSFSSTTPKPKKQKKQTKIKPYSKRNTASRVETETQVPPSKTLNVENTIKVYSPPKTTKAPQMKTGKEKKDKGIRNDRNLSSRKRPRNRMKWSKEENIKLWKSISRHGNNWTEIKKELGARTYYQIKDKGRRLLSVQGWISGRNKKYSHEAMYSAKLIANSVLTQKLHEKSTSTT